MGRRSKISHLPEELREEFHERIRGAWYGSLDSQTAWLKGKGYQVARSSVARYVQRLRDIDGARGMEVAELVGAKTTARKKRQVLLERLGAIRLEELEIIRQLGELSESE